MSTAEQNRIVFADLLSSNPLMPAVLAAAIRKQGEDVVKAGPNFDHGGPVSNGDWYECAQLSIKMLDADPSLTGVLSLVCSTPLTNPFIQWFAVAAVEEYGDQDPDDFEVPDGVDPGAWAAAAERAGQAMALCALWEGDTGAGYGCRGAGRPQAERRNGQERQGPRRPRRAGQRRRAGAHRECLRHLP